MCGFRFLDWLGLAVAGVSLHGDEYCLVDRLVGDRDCGVASGVLRGMHRMAFGPERTLSRRRIRIAVCAAIGNVCIPGCLRCGTIAESVQTTIGFGIVPRLGFHLVPLRSRKDSDWTPPSPPGRKPLPNPCLQKGSESDSTPFEEGG